MTIDIFRILGFGGTGLIVIAVLFPSLVYRGKAGERYSILNHFISELGETGVSRAAWLFNAGLFLGGLVLLPYTIGLGMVFRSLMGWLGTAAAVVTLLGVAGVGLFPMNNIKAHTLAAMTYFRAGLLMVFFYGLAIYFQPTSGAAIPQAANLLSVVAFLAYGAFLALPLMKRRKPKPGELFDPEQEPVRPRLWALPSLEWLVFFSAIAWLFGMTFFV